MCVCVCLIVRIAIVCKVAAQMCFWACKDLLLCFANHSPALLFMPLRFSLSDRLAFIPSLCKIDAFLWLFMSFCLYSCWSYAGCMSVLAMSIKTYQSCDVCNDQSYQSIQWTQCSENYTLHAYTGHMQASTTRQASPRTHHTRRTRHTQLAAGRLHTPNCLPRISAIRHIAHYTTQACCTPKSKSAVREYLHMHNAGTDLDYICGASPGSPAVWPVCDHWLNGMKRAYNGGGSMSESLAMFS